MTSNMDRGLDEIIADKASYLGPEEPSTIILTYLQRDSRPRNNRRGGGGGGGGDRRRNDRGRQDYPRDGIQKSGRSDSSRSDSRHLDSEWVHDRYDDNNSSRRAPAPRHRRPEADPSRGSKLKVENIHYDLTQEDLDELFQRIGPVAKLQLLFDRAGRSEGIAFVTYESVDDALEAIKQFDGANANGQPIRLTQVGGGRNPFASAVMPGRPLSERISAPGGRSRSMSPDRRFDREDAASKGIDRYVPGGSGRDRSPAPRRRGGGDRGGRRPGARREPRNGGRDQDGGRSSARPSKKTQEELDAEMADYFGGGGAAPAAAAEPATQAAAPAAATAAAPNADDIDMIE